MREALFGYSAPADRVAEAAIEVLKKEGATIVDPANVATIRQLPDLQWEVNLYEFKAGIEAYLAGLVPGAPARTLADIIKFNEMNKAVEMPFFGQEALLESVKKGPLTSTAYLTALRQCQDLSRRQGIDAVMAEHRLDALVAPTGDPAWVIDLVNGDSNKGWWSSPAAAAAGYPHITVPAGYVHGLPVGLSFFGRAWSEPTLI